MNLSGLNASASSPHICGILRHDMTSKVQVSPDAFCEYYGREHQYLPIVCTNRDLYILPFTDRYGGDLLPRLCSDRICQRNYVVPTSCATQIPDNRMQPHSFLKFRSEPHHLSIASPEKKKYSSAYLQNSLKHGQDFEVGYAEVMVAASGSLCPGNGKLFANLDLIFWMFSQLPQKPCDRYRCGIMSCQ